MYAIVSIAGQQHKVEKGKKVFVHRLPGAIGEEVSFNTVLLINDQEKVNVGTPYLPDAVVLAQIVSHLRGDKVLVFKKKRRKGYQKLNGHRQNFTEILIEDISESGIVKSSGKKKSASARVDDQPEIAEEVNTGKEVKKAAAKPVAKKETAAVKPEKPAAKSAPKKQATAKAATAKAADKKPAAKAKSSKKESES